MSDTNGTAPETRILSLDAARRPKDRPSDFATKQDVVRIVAEEVSKVHEYYLNQIPAFTARMIQDGLMAYGLIVAAPGTADIAPAVATESAPESVETLPADAELFRISKVPFEDTLTGDPAAPIKVSDLFSGAEP